LRHVSAISLILSVITFLPDPLNPLGEHERVAGRGAADGPVEEDRCRGEPGTGGVAQDRQSW
jgi:hypothetical protein